jgi:hypothetical protein
LGAGAGPPPKLLGRSVECQVIDRLVSDVIAGASRVLVLRGDPGIGKTALLGYLSDRLVGWRVTRVVGVESDMRLPFSGVHQFCTPLLADLGKLPAPQRAALETVFGLGSGPVPDRSSSASRSSPSLRRPAVRLSGAGPAIVPQPVSDQCHSQCLPRV